MPYTTRFNTTPSNRRPPNNAYIRLSMCPVIATLARTHLSKNEALYASTLQAPQSVMDCWLVPPTVTTQSIGDYMRLVRQQFGAVFFFTMVREVIQ